MVAVENDNFRAWFADSKVVRDGAPQLLFHATDKQYITFRPYCHFGTQEAALSRAAAKQIENPRLVPVYLKIERPLRVLDDQAENNALRLLDLPEREGVFDRSEADAVRAAISAQASQWALEPDTDEFNRKKWLIGAGEVAKAAKGKGYDGLVYRNEVEGADDSFVPFDTSQIWIDTNDKPEV